MNVEDFNPNEISADHLQSLANRSYTGIFKRESAEKLLQALARTIIVMEIEAEASSGIIRSYEDEV